MRREKGREKGSEDKIRGIGRKEKRRGDGREREKNKEKTTQEITWKGKREKK